jgi:WD40 repeat protein
VSRKIALGLVAVAGAAACLFLIVVMAHQGLQRAGAWATPMAALAGVVAAVAAVWATAPRPRKAPLPPELAVPGWVVSRPAELAAVVKAVVSGRAGTVGITTGLYGVGGFGKTTLARMICADQRVRRRFGGRVYLVTVGRDVRGAAAIAAKVNGVIQLVSGENATFTDPELAGQQLGMLLNAGPRRLLVLDDVWEPEQLGPLTEGGKQCARLVTTRVPELVAGLGTAVRVDQMSANQARALLTFGLPPVDPAVVDGLLGVTGQWPLLLRLVNKILADYARVATDVSAQGAGLLERLHVGGPAVVDDLLGEDGRGLDVGKPAERARAVQATIGASTRLLDRHDAERFAELGVFAEDETVPFRLVAKLWRTTGELGDLQAAQVCQRLVQLALVSLPVGPVHGIVMHDVIRDFLRAEIGQQRLAELSGALLDAVAADLPTASLADSAAAYPVQVAWWKLGHEDRYLWDHLIEHLLDAGRPSDADAVAGDLRWVGARLERFGPAAPAADLSAVATPRAVRLRAVLTRAAHLLAPSEPTRAVVDVLHSRVANDPDWGPQASALRDICPRPRLVSRWPPPDLAEPALLRVVTSPTSFVSALAVAPDGSWLAAGGWDGVQILDVATGQERITLKGTAGRVRATESVTGVAVAPDGSWLATGSSNGARIWDVATGQERATVKDHTDREVTAVAVAPDGSWLATGSWNGARIWDVATWQKRATLKDPQSGVTAMAVAPDGSWLATGGSDGTVRIWDVAAWHERATFKGPGDRPHATESVNAVAVAPDGSWLATSSSDGTVRIWDVATAQERATLEHHSNRRDTIGMAVAPDGSWLATGGSDGTVRIWDVATAQERATLEHHSDRMSAMGMAVAPDGSWLATGGLYEVRIWDVASGQKRTILKGHTDEEVTAVAVAPDRSWLTTRGDDGVVRIWDVATRQERATLRGPTERMWGKDRFRAVAVAPDGSWLASCGRDEVRIWDVATGQERATLKGTDWAKSVAVAPDGSWLATGGRNGTVRIWDVATGLERASFKVKWPLKGTDQLLRTDRVDAVAVAPDGSWLATGSWNGVRIWDVATWRKRATLKDPQSGVTAMAVAPDGSWLATGGHDRTVRIWDAVRGQKRAALSGHTSYVEALAVAPDGSWLASADGDRTVRIWDEATWQTQALMRVDRNVRACAWLDYSALLVGGSAGLYLFDLLTGTSPAVG